MATLAELADFVQTPDYQALIKKIRTAIVIKAVAIGNLAVPTPAQIDFAKSALRDPSSESQIVSNYVIAANSTATIAQIVAATDSLIQTNVNNAVDKILSL